MDKTPGKNTPRNSKRGCLCKNGTYHVDCCDGSLQAQGIGKINIIIMAKNPTGLEAIDEGNGTGYRLIGRNPDNYDNIGKDAVDFSYNNTTLKYGANGNGSLTAGDQTEASGENAVAFGNTTSASGKNSVALGRGCNAFNNESFAFGSQCAAFGKASFATNFATIASGSNSHAEGYLTAAYGNNSHVEGEQNFARSENEHSGGVYGTDYTSQNDNTDRLVNYGNGSNGNSRSDAFTIFKNGAVRFFRATLASIQNTVKEGFLIFNSDDNNRPYIHDGTKWHGLAYKNVGYTVANLPAGETGQTAYVTDAANISYRGVVAGSGTETALVFYDGTNWIYH